METSDWAAGVPMEEQGNYTETAQFGGLYAGRQKEDHWEGEGVPKVNKGDLLRKDNGTLLERPRKRHLEKPTRHH